MISLKIRVTCLLILTCVCQMHHAQIRQFQSDILHGRKGILVTMATTDVSSIVECTVVCLEIDGCVGVNYNGKMNMCECVDKNNVQTISDPDYKFSLITPSCQGTPPPTVQGADVTGTDQSEANYTCRPNEFIQSGGTKTISCQTGSTWPSPTMQCIDCFTDPATFNKSVSITTSGVTCSRWDEITRFSEWPDNYFPLDGSKNGAGNQCRLPAMAGTDNSSYAVPFVFCPVEDTRSMRDTCAVPSCSAPDIEACGGPPQAMTGAIRSYPVAADRFLATYACINKTVDQPTKYCPVARCIGANNWTEPSVSCSASECYNATTLEYEGKIACTESGRTCQFWIDTYPHVPQWFPENPGFAVNYCRSPDGSRPWCYTTAPELRWEHCPVPPC